MKAIQTTRVINIPSDVVVWVKARTVYVKGPRGFLTRSFKPMAVDIAISGKGKKKKLSVSVFFGRRKGLASIRTITSHIENMITGVTKGFRYKMRLVYAHFPINVNINDSKDLIEIRNFLGEKIVRSIPMKTGVTIIRSATTKDELILEGNDIEAVSSSAATIKNSCNVKNKDIRKFLDGIYVSEKGEIDDE